MSDTPTIELVDIYKSFGSTRVLEGVGLPLFRGEVHSLMGENGAGKSTLVKIMAGLHLPDKGAVRIGGQQVLFRSTAQAQQAGVSVIYQEPTLFRDLSVAENVFMHRQPKTSYGWIDYAEMNRVVSQHLRQLGVSLRPDDPVLGLSIADQQIVEIIKALTFDAKVLIMDEPTAALSLEEVKRLFQVVERLRAKGVAIMFVSHRLEEVFAISQRITVMRDGRVVGSGPIKGWTTEEVIRKMVGRSLEALYPKEKVEPGKVVLRVRGLRRAGVFRDISFEVRQGEIVGLAGLVGAGRSEVARAIFGIDPLDNGEVFIGERTLAKHTPQAAMAAGIGLVPEDRQQQGLVMEMAVVRNATLTVLHNVQRLGLVSKEKEREIAARWTQRMQLKGHIDEPANILSGGNQQKVVLAKWLATQPKLLIVDEPTRGVDVGAKSEVHRTLSQLAKDGLAIIMISSDLPEIMGMADRVLVMHEGKLTAELSRSEATEEAIMYAATGQVSSQGERQSKLPVTDNHDKGI
ncbi:MAG: sugar ABC transporter ATP-binding protein [Verrucomicrobia bacterium]|nr:sugar ABC transporter ATP-binding protein [Verrucomicrobiota bacterium]